MDRKDCVLHLTLPRAPEGREGGRVAQISSFTETKPFTHSLTLCSKYQALYYAAHLWISLDPQLGRVTASVPYNSVCLEPYVLPSVANKESLVSVQAGHVCPYPRYLRSCNRISPQIGCLVFLVFSETTSGFSVFGLGCMGENCRGCGNLLFIAILHRGLWPHSKEVEKATSVHYF